MSSLSPLSGVPPTISLTIVSVWQGLVSPCGVCHRGIFCKGVLAKKTFCLYNNILQKEREQVEAL